MKLGSTFAAYRYFLVPSEQISLFDVVDESRHEAVEKFFDKAVTDKKVPFEIEDRKHILAYERKVSKNILVFKFASEKRETKYHESDTGIESAIESNLPFVYLVFDIIRQLLLIEINSSVFKKVSQAQQKIQKCFELAFFIYGFEVIFEEIIDENTFWKYVEKSGSIHDVTVTLNSPNLFSGFLEIGTMLKDIRELYNNTQTTLKVTNKHAPLSGITKENQELAAAVKYASAGGGEWALTVETKAGNRTYRSRNNIKKVNLTPISEFPLDDIALINEDIIKALDSVEFILPMNNEAEDE